MEVIFLGTATSQGIPVIGCNCPVCKSDDPKNHRLRSSLLIKVDQKNYVIDVGPDFRSQILSNNVASLESVFLTHEHADHVQGLDDLRPFIFKQNAHMPIYALQRVVDDVKTRFAYAFAANPYPGIPRFDMRVIDFGDTIQLENLSLEVLKVMHGNLPIAGFKIGKLVYITDGKKLEQNTMDAIRNCDHLVINALRQESHYSHFNLKEALDIIEIVKPKRAYITHISHKMGDYSEIEKQIPDHVCFAFDGLQLKI